MVMHWWCIGGALVAHWWCIGGDALVVHWWCIGGALVVHWWCIGGALLMNWCVTIVCFNQSVPNKSSKTKKFES